MASRFLLLILAAMLIPPPVGGQEKTLKDHGQKTDSASLIEFLRRRSLTPSERKKIDTLIQQLGHRLYRKREVASKELIARGTVVIRLLERELTNKDAEISRRARDCISAIQQGPSIEVVLAVIRFIEQKKMIKAGDSLMLFLPYAEDQQVEQAVLETLLSLANEKKTFLDALKKHANDGEPARRAAVGYVFSRVALNDHKAIVKQLLQDSSPLVRFRTGKGMMMSGDKSAVQPMIDLLQEAPMDLAWNVEALLFRLAGAQSPSIISNGNTPQARLQWRNEWEKWWQAHESKIDLAQLHKGDLYRGWTLIPLMHSGEIYEIDRKKKVRWRLTGIPQPRDAQILPGNRVLVSEAKTHRVTERDRRTGKIYWEYPAKNTSFCKRLPNGNTIIGMAHQILIVTPAKQRVFEYKPEKTFYIHGMDHLPNGQFILISMKGLLRQVNRAGKVVFSKQIGDKGANWCAVSGMSNGHYLVTSISPGEVIEVDRNGKVYWRHKVKDSSCAKALPNGNILIASFSQRALREITRSKKTVWEHKTASTPWRIRLR